MYHLHPINFIALMMKDAIMLLSLDTRYDWWRELDLNLFKKKKFLFIRLFLQSSLHLSG